MANNVFKVDLRADNLEEFKQDVIDYIKIRWGVVVNFNDLNRNRRQRLTYLEIESIICDYFNVTYTSVRKPRIRGRVSDAKSFIAYFAYFDGHKLIDIGKYLYEGCTNNDHTNIMYRRDKVMGNINNIPKWKKWYGDISLLINKFIENGIQEQKFDTDDEKL